MDEAGYGFAGVWEEDVSLGAHEKASQGQGHVPIFLFPDGPIENVGR